MTDQKPNGLLKHIRKLIAAETYRNVSDRDLLDRFLNLHEEAAFAALMERHGSMVLAVCQRALGNRHDAEDACQATFLVLARKAGSIRKKDSLGSWLHGVARRVASDLKKQLVRSKAGGVWPGEVPGGDTVREVGWREVQAALDEELQQLPERYRAPVILCCLEGKTRDEAARQLGWSLGSLRGRLDRGRELLRARLVRRGVTLAAALLATALAEKAATASLSPTLTLATAKAALFIVSGKTITGTGISAKVVSLSEGVLKTMFLTKCKLALVLLALTALFGSFGANGLPPFAHAQGQAPKGKLVAPVAQATPSKSAPKASEGKEPEAAGVTQFVEALPWTVTKVDAENRTLSVAQLAIPHVESSASDFVAEISQTIRPLHGVRSLSALHDFPVAKDAKVFIDGKESALDDLSATMRVTLRLATDKAAISRIDAVSLPARPVLRKADAEKNTITLAAGGKELTFPLTFDTKIFFMANDSGYSGGKEGEFTDLKAGMRIDMQLGTEESKIVARVIRAYR